MDLSFPIVRNAAGAIDIEQSVQAARAVVEKYKAKRETEEADIELAVAAAFDEHPESLQNRKAIVGTAIILMKTPPSAWTDMEKRIGNYLTDNTDRAADPEKGIVADKPRTRLFGHKAGPKGGYFAWKNVPAQS